MLGRTDAEALATPINRIEGPAQARLLMQADPSAVNAAMLLGKAAKSKLTGRDLAQAQKAAFDAFIDAHGKQTRRPKPKPRRR